MEPLTIFGAVTGGISAASEILKTLEWAIDTAGRVRAAPEQAHSTLRDVRMIRKNLEGFERLKDHLSSSVPQNRLAYIPLEDCKNTFIDCVSTLDELENVIRPLKDPSLDVLSLSNRLQWAMKDARIADLSKRVHNAQSSLGFMLTIMQHDSLLEVSSAVTCLAQVTQKIAQDVADILRGRSVLSNHQPRINNQRQPSISDDTSTLRPTTFVGRPDSMAFLPAATARTSIYSTTSTPSSPPTDFDLTPRRFAFEQDLEQSVAYRRIPKWSQDDISFRSSILNYHALSFLSHCSLGDVSAMSFVALPIFRDDISNNKHYSFGSQHTVTAAIGSDTQVLQVLPQITPSLNFPPPESLPPARSLPQSPQPPPSPAWSETDLFKLGASGVSRPASILRRKGIFKLQKEKPPELTVATVDLPAQPPTPPRTPRQSQSFIDRTELLIRENITSEDTFSLNQLSKLRVTTEDYALCHKVGGYACFNVVGAPGFREKYDKDTNRPQDLMAHIRGRQLDLAARRGHLEYFRCTSCNLSLAQVVMSTQEHWDETELWCGENDCATKMTKAAPFNVCPCYEKLQQMGKTDKFYGCRNLLSKTVQCDRCFDQCAPCAQMAKFRGLVRADQQERTNQWINRLYTSQDALIQLQEELIEEKDEDKFRLRMAVLDREKARFDTILETLSKRDLLFDERQDLRGMLHREKRIGYSTDRKKAQLLKSVIGKLQEYGKLYGARIPRKHLQVLEERQQILSKRTNLLLLMTHQQIRGSLGTIGTDLSFEHTTAGATIQAVTLQMEVFRERLRALRYEISGEI